MNEPITVTAPSDPDPSWDYYELYISIVEAKSKLDEIVNLISKEEIADDAFDTQIRTALIRVQQDLENTLDSFLPEDDDEFEE